MSLIPKDMTPVYKATIAKGTSATRWQRPVYVDLPPPLQQRLSRRREHPGVARPRAGGPV